VIGGFRECIRGFPAILKGSLTLVDVAIVTISTFERGAAAGLPVCQDAVALPAQEICTP